MALPNYLMTLFSCFERRSLKRQYYLGLLQQYQGGFHGSIRSSRSQMFFKIDVLKNFANFTGKHLCWSLLKVAGLQTYTFSKKRLQHRRFPVKFAKFLRTPFFTEHLRRLFYRAKLVFTMVSQYQEWYSCNICNIEQEPWALNLCGVICQTF